MSLSRLCSRVLPATGRCRQITSWQSVRPVPAALRSLQQRELNPLHSHALPRQRSSRLQPHVQAYVRTYGTPTSKQGDDDDNDDKSPAVKPKSPTENAVFTVPNLLTMGRIAFSPMIGYWIVTHDYQSALVGLTVLGLTDWLDGYIARTFNQSSVLGTFLDPVGDKVLVSIVTLALTYDGILPLPLTITMVGRDVLLLAGGFYFRYKSMEGEKFTFKRYFDPSAVNFVIEPSTVSKVNTAAQLSLLGLSLSHAAFAFPTLDMLQYLWWFVGATTVASGTGYAMSTGKVFRERSAKGFGASK
eukprot:GFYU01050932.1.p1 GENE.GFYU01050932.1~~GFYU01050932.1.p1  ORF type:complete len:301 (-),score=50.30 GFYU01050932.1:51-953(-)